jgi:hypothetical protein
MTYKTKGMPEMLPKGISPPESANDSPHPIYQVTDQEFWHWFSMYSAGRSTSFHQVIGLPGEGVRSITAIHVFWYHDRAYAIQVKHNHPPNLDGAATFQPIYYRIGCEHKMKTQVNVGNCLNQYTCQNCGRVEIVDSSG